MKGVGRLIEVYGLKGDKLSEPNPQEYQENKIDKHTDDEVPSIAIIPFENKGKEEDVFYAYGISADLISDCSGAGLIRVASLKDIENLDYKTLATSELASKLFVRYIAHGSLWKMDDMFQLSVELYDTKDQKVVWSDRWQEKWDNLPTIKMNLSDGLLKALDTTSKVERKVETTNTEAYEFYLKAKHKYEKRKNTDDTEIARGLLNKAIELDDNLIVAKVLLGTTYTDMGDYDEAMEIHTSALQQAEQLGDKLGMGNSLNNIGNVYWNKGDFGKALEYLGRSLALYEEIGDKRGMGYSLLSIGIVHHDKGDYEKALDYYNRSLAMREQLGDKSGMGVSLHNIGLVHSDKGEYDKALDYYGRSLAIQEELGDKRGMGNSLGNIGIVHHDKGDQDTALDYYNRSLAIFEELGYKAGM
jgi:tetratricopeptide (TPR) repeat protein